MNSEIAQRLAESLQVQSLTDEHERVVRGLEAKRAELEAAMRARVEAERVKREQVERAMRDSWEAERAERAERDRAMRDSWEAERAERARLFDALQGLLARQDRADQHVEETRRAIAEIESYLALTAEGDTLGHTPDVLTTRIRQREKKQYAAYVATLPLVTPEQVQIIKALLKERKPSGYWEGSAEKHLLRLMGVNRLEDIRGFERAMDCLGYKSPIQTLTADQVQTIKALLKETDSDEKSFLAAMGVPRIEDIKGFEGALKLLGQRMSKRTPT